MDENFLTELVAEGEKRFKVDVPLAMTMGDVITNLKGTVDEIIGAADGWKDAQNLKMVIAIEAQGWAQILDQAAKIATADGLGLVNSIGDGDNAAKLIGLFNSGNKVMKHFYVHGEQGNDALKVYFLFRVTGGIKLVSSVDFG